MLANTTSSIGNTSQTLCIAGFHQLTVSCLSVFKANADLIVSRPSSLLPQKRGMSREEATVLTHARVLLMFMLRAGNLGDSDLYPSNQHKCSDYQSGPGYKFKYRGDHNSKFTLRGPNIGCRPLPIKLGVAVKETEFLICRWQQIQRMWTTTQEK
jgi:hypothetical protein